MEFMKAMFDDYANYKLEDGYIIEELRNIKSPIFYKIEPVVICLEYFYNKAIETEKLEMEEVNLFEDGFNYLFEIVNYLKSLRTEFFEGSIERMNEFSKSVILLLQIYEYEDEIFYGEEENKEVEKSILGFDEKVFEYIREGQEAPDELVLLAKEAYERAILELDIEEYSVIDIFYQIAEELDILEVEEEGFEI